MTCDFITMSTVDGIGTITLNRPEKRNALNGQFIQELSHAIRFMSEDSHTRVVIICGAGEHFCAGADIAWMQTIATGSADANYEDAQKLADLLYQLYVFTKPTIVLAHGATLGGAQGLVSVCDIAIASKNAVFGFTEAKMGIVPSVISPYVIAAIGERAAHYYFLTAERFGAEEACRIGLVHQITENSELMNVGMATAKKLLENGPHALMAVKQLIRHVGKEKITENLAQKTAENLANLRASAEAQEGLKAFMEKREPKWV